jgi:pimeloyl-ACP methyl ester carboxylesterase
MIDIPTLIINGDGDQLTPVAMAKKIQEAVRGSRLFVIENASHGVVQTHASIINNLILEFIVK